MLCIVFKCGGGDFKVGYKGFDLLLGAEGFGVKHLKSPKYMGNPQIRVKGFKILWKRREICTATDVTGKTQVENRSGFH